MKSRLRAITVQSHQLAPNTELYCILTIAGANATPQVGWRINYEDEETTLTAVIDAQTAHALLTGMIHHNKAESLALKQLAAGVGSFKTPHRVRWMGLTPEGAEAAQEMFAQARRDIEDQADREMFERAEAITPQHTKLTTYQQLWCLIVGLYNKSSGVPSPEEAEQRFESFWLESDPPKQMTLEQARSVWEHLFVLIKQVLTEA